MKLLHVIASVDPRGGGVVESVLQMHAGTRETVQHEAVTLDVPGRDYLQSFPFRVYPMGTGNRGRGWRHPLKRYGYTPKLVPWLKAHVADYDAVIVHGLWNYTKMAAVQVLPHGTVPYFCFSHGMMDPWFRRRYPLKHLGKQLSWLVCEGRLLAGAQAVIFTTEEERRLAADAFFGYSFKSAVFSLGISAPPPESDAQHTASAAALPGLRGRKYLLYLSRIHPKKGCDLLIDAFAKVASDMPDTDLVIAGPDQEGWVRRLQAQAETRGIAGRIHWPGMLSGDAKWGAYYGSQAFILPSHQENFGIVVAEAMACAKPVLTTDKVNIWREIRDSHSGLIASDTAEGILSLLQNYCRMDQSAHRAMARQAKTCFQEKYDTRTTGPQLISYIQTHISSNPGQKSKT